MITRPQIIKALKIKSELTINQLFRSPTENMRLLLLNGVWIKPNKRQCPDIFHCQVTKQLENEVYWIKKKKESLWLKTQMKPRGWKRMCMWGGAGVLLFSLTEPVIPNTKQITAKEGCLTDSWHQISAQLTRWLTWREQSLWLQPKNTLPLTLSIQGNAKKFRPDSVSALPAIYKNEGVLKVPHCNVPFAENSHQHPLDIFSIEN